MSCWLGLAPAPEEYLSLPRLPRETFLALDFGQLFTASMGSVILAFLFVDLLDTAGTLIGVGHLAGFVDDRGDFPGSERAFVADAVGTSVGAALGTSTVTTYIESATGVEEGGRTGLTAVVAAGFFLLALFHTPVFVAVPAVAEIILSRRPRTSSSFPIPATRPNSSLPILEIVSCSRMARFSFRAVSANT